MPQCSGITQKGVRCKVQCAEGQHYCHHHKHQENHHHLNNPIQHRSKYEKGFIYVYTLEHLASSSPSKKEWLQTRRQQDGAWEVFEPKKEILLKVGLTTGTVVNRLKQWEAKCGHKLVVLGPDSKGLYQSRTRRLMAMLKLPQAKKNRDALEHYEPSNGGFRSDSNLSAVERTIHETLWGLYGKGSVVCQGCQGYHRDEFQKKENDRYGIHLEWFKVSRKEISTVFSIINEVCRRYNP